MKDKTRVKIIKKERDRFYLKFPFLEVPVETNKGFLESIKSSEDYILVDAQA